MSDGGIRCACGHRITTEEVTQNGLVMVRWQPLFVYLKYRCAECGQLGEELIPTEEWDGSLLSGEVAADATAESAEPPGWPSFDADMDLGEDTSDDNDEAPACSEDRDLEAFARQLLSLDERAWRELRNTL